MVGWENVTFKHTLWSLVCVILGACDTALDYHKDFYTHKIAISNIL